MSHTIEHREYGVSKAKQTIENELNRYVRHRCYREGASGLYNPIRWINKVFETYDEARNYIETHDKGFYDNLAVRFKAKYHGDSRRRQYYLVKIEYHE